MIQVSEIHYGILQAANHTDSEYLKQISVAQRDHYINREKDILLQWLTAQDETNDSVRRVLQELVVRGKKLSGERDGDSYVFSFPEDFYKHKALYGVGKIAGCPDTRDIRISRPGSEKFQSARTNKSALRIWDFQRTFAQEGSNGLRVLVDKNMEIEVFLDYIRKIPDVAYPSGTKNGFYINSRGEKISEDVHLDLESPWFRNQIVDLATLEIKKDYENFQGYQAAKDFILSINRI